MLLLIVLGLIFQVGYAYGHLIDGDAIQLLRHAHRLVNEGVVTPYGPQSSSGSSGNVPGSFLTLAVGLPMLVWNSPHSALAFLTLLHLLSFLMFCDVVKNFVRARTLLFLGVAYWLNPYRASEVFLWNPGYMFFASLLHLWTAWHLHMSKSDLSRFFWSIAQVISVFVAAQIHPSAVILGLISLGLFYKRLLRVSWPGLIVGLAVGLISLWPFFLYTREHPELIPKPGQGDGFLFLALVKVYPFLKGVWYWFVFGSSIFPTHVYRDTSLSWVTNHGLRSVIEVSLEGVKWLATGFGLLLSFRVNWEFFKMRWRSIPARQAEGHKGPLWIESYVLVAAASSVVALAILPTTPQYWHLLYVLPSALVPMTLFVDHRLASESWRRRTWVIVMAYAIYFSVFNVLGAIESRKHSWSKPLSQSYREMCTGTCELKN